MQDNLVRFPKKNNRPSLIDEYHRSLMTYYTSEIPECPAEKAMMATAVFHFIAASQVSLNHMGKSDESYMMLKAAKSIENSWPHYEFALKNLLTELENCYF